MNKWTEQQKNAFTQGGRVIVSAAAGSGKTAVLVERVIRTVLKGGIDIDKLLIVTFTEAAANEVKQKIFDAFYKCLEKEPLNWQLKRQICLLDKAEIATIHAFCLSVLKNHIYSSDIPADFSVASENDAFILKNKALNDVLEKYYSKIKIHRAFSLLCNGYGGIKNDNQLRKIILALHNFCLSLPEGAMWLNDCLQIYRTTLNLNDAAKTIWGKVIIDYITESLKRCRKLNGQSIEFVKENLTAKHGYYELFCREYVSIDHVTKKLPNVNWDEAKALIDLIEFENCSRYGAKRKNMSLTTKELQNLAKEKRNKIKKEIKEIKNLINVSKQTIFNRLRKVIPQIKVLKNLVFAMSRKYKKLKLEERLLDFNDLEIQTLRLIKKSDLAEVLKQKYHEILIDEYQDINKVQNEIFESIAGNNFFMVGDVKQCIYKFRNSAPELFINKCCEQDSSCSLIFLRDNFRSQSNIINFVNDVFSRLMSREVGGVCYDAEQQLKFGADYYGRANNPIEMCLVSDNDHQFDDTQNDVGCTVQQAKWIISKIQNMIGIFDVYDKKKAVVRKARYEDFAILSRSRSGFDTYQDLFCQACIPLIANSKRKYLHSAEILTTLSFLQIINNPLQDIPLIAVLKSPIFNFTANELANIRMENKEIYFYEAMEMHASKDAKTKKFLQILEDLRNTSVYLPVDQLIWSIYKQFNYFQIINNRPNQRLRRENLRLLLEKAAEFEERGIRGLFSFVNSIRTTMLEGNDFTPAQSFCEGADAVTITTIHKSKGLEFPIVFLVDINKRFNKRDINNLPVIWHEDYGIGIDCIDGEIRAKYPSLQKNAVKIIKNADLTSEEMRVLYVALTRAREQLILVGNLSEVEARVWTQAEKLNNEQAVVKATSFADWVLPILLTHQKAQHLRSACQASDICADPNLTFDLNVQITHPTDILSSIEVSSDAKESHITTEKIKLRYDCSELGRIPVKISVSEVKRIETQNNDVQSIKILKDIELKEQVEFSNREKGLLTHFVMQHINFKNSNVMEQIEKMLSDGLISQAQAKNLNISSIEKFLQSGLGARLKAASHYAREVKFYIKVPITEIYKNISERQTYGEKILLQGVVDCYFEELGQVVILDYKIDNVNSNKAHLAALRYKVQLDYYTKGLEAMLNKKVKERYIYFLKCQTAVKI